MEQSQIYSAFNVSQDMCVYGAGQPNDTAQTTLVNGFICPSDGHTERIGDNVAYSNYFASLGATAAQEGGSTYTNMEPITQRWGIYIANINYNTPPCLNGQPSTDYQKVTGCTVAAITDGTSNTAAFAESWRGHEVGSTLPPIGDPTIVLIYNSDPSTTLHTAPVAHRPLGTAPTAIAARNITARSHRRPNTIIRFRPTLRSMIVAQPPIQPLSTTFRGRTLRHGAITRAAPMR